MRSVLVALLVSSAVLLAGCSDDDGGHEDHYECPDGTELNLDDFPEHHNETFNPLAKCPSASGSSSSSAPNVLPTLSLTVTDDAGNETVVGTLMGNLTFSAEGSMDSDGSITGIAVSVTDSNTTRTASLFDPVAKSFKSATFKFDRPGVVNVTVALVDDRAGFAVNQSKVYINHPQMVSAGGIMFPGGADTPEFDDPCVGGEALLVANHFKPVSFTLFAGATRVDVTPVSPDAVVTICNAEDVPVSEQKVQGPVSTLPDAVLTPPVGTESYKVGVFRALAPTTQNSMPTDLEVVVHYEPQTAAAPAE